MNKQETLELFELGVEAWNDRMYDIEAQWERASDIGDQATASRCQDLCRADFSNHEFFGPVDFSDFRFSGEAMFSNALFGGDANFAFAKFVGRSWFDDARFEREVDFTNTRFQSNSSFVNTQFSGMSFFGGCEFAWARFEKAKFLQSTVFDQVRFFHDSTFKRAIFDGPVSMSNMLANGPINFSDSHCKSALNLNGSHFSRLRFESVSATRGLSFASCHLGHATFNNSDLRGANFLGAHMDEQTDFTNAKLQRSKIDSFSLACMNDNGGITKGMRMQMDIKDDVAQLRQSFGGFKTLLHLIFLAVFAFPYVWFVVSRYAEASFAGEQHAETIALWDAFCRYVFNGGLNWQTGYQLHWTFLTFVVALLFNALRVLLLRKTMQLELSQSARELPEMFSLSEKVIFWGKPMGFTWGRLVWVNDILFWIQSAAVIFSTFHFLTMRVPV